MDINIIRSLVTFFLFIFFIVMIYQVFSRKNKKHYEDAGNLLFDDGDERSTTIGQKNKNTSDMDQTNMSHPDIDQKNLKQKISR